MTLLSSERAKCICQTAIREAYAPSWQPFLLFGVQNVVCIAPQSICVAVHVLTCGPQSELTTCSALVHLNPIFEPWELVCLQDALAKALLQKEQMRTELRQQLETQSKTFSSVEKDAQNLLLKALHAGRKVTVRTHPPPANHHQIFSE